MCLYILLDVKTITTLSIIPKGEGDIETRGIPDFKNTDIATYCTLTKAQFDGYVAYDSGLWKFSGYINDRGYPAYGIAARYGAYQFGQLPCAVPELLAVKDRQAHVAMTYRKSSYSKTYVSDPVYYLINFKSILTSTLKKGILGYMLAQNKIDANIPLERMNFTNLTDAEGFFCQCDLSEFNENRIADFYCISSSNIDYLFAEATGKSHYDLTKFRCGACYNATGLFQNNVDVVEIVLPELGDSSLIRNINSAFEGCTLLQKIQLNPNQTITYIKIQNANRMFYLI